MTDSLLPTYQSFFIHVYILNSLLAQSFRKYEKAKVILEMIKKKFFFSHKICHLSVENDFLLYVIILGNISTLTGSAPTIIIINVVTILSALSFLFLPAPLFISLIAKHQFLLYISHYRGMYIYKYIVAVFVVFGLSCSG